MTIEAIIQASHEHPIYLFFTTRYCGTCRGFQRSLDTLSQAMVYPILSIDAEESRSIAKAFDVTGVPVLIRIEKGLEIARRSGSTTSDELTQWLNEHPFGES